MSEFPLRAPTVVECLPLLSPFRLRDAIYRVPDEDPLGAAFEAAWSQRATLARERAIILLALFDLPTVTAWMVARPLCVHLLSSFQPALATAWDADSLRLRALLVEGRLASTADEQHPPHTVITDRRQSHPLTAMHLLSAHWRRVGDRVIEATAPTTAWRTYALACHQAYRQVEAFYAAAGVPSGAIANQTYSTALSLRYLLQSLVIVHDATGTGPTKADIRLAMNNLTQRYRVEHRPEWPTSVREHERTIGQAFHGTWRRAVRLDPLGQADPHPNPHPQPEPEPAATLRGEDRAWDRASDGPLPWGGRCVTRYVGVPADLEATGEGLEDYAVDYAEVPSGSFIDPRRARLAARRVAAVLHREALFFPFSREYLQLHDYARLYGLLLATPLDDLTLEEQGVVVALLLTLHLGIAAEGGGLLEAQVETTRLLTSDGRSRPPGAIVLDRKTFIVTRPVPPGHAGYETVPVMASDPLARPIQRTVKAPLPPCLHRPIERYLTSRDAWLRTVHAEADPRLFLRATDPPQPLALADVAAFLRLRGAAAPERLLRKLVRSFMPFYVTRLGLDPIVACYVSGRVPRTFATKLFYCHVAADRLAEHYWRTASQADRLIRRAAAALGLHLGPVPASPEAPPLTFRGYGSRVVPRRRTSATFFEAVRAALQRHARRREEAARILYHNLYASYAWIVAHLLSGARPTNDGGVSRVLGTSHPTRLKLGDKNSPWHLEWRTQRPSATLEALRGDLRTARQDARDLPSFDYHADRALGGPLLFLLRWNGELYLPTFRDITAVLQLFPEVAATFPFPANVGRHLLETMLTEAGADRASQDYALGHQRRWLEALNRFSAAELGFLERHFAGHVDALVRRLDLDLVPYRVGAPS